MSWLNNQRLKKLIWLFLGYFDYNYFFRNEINNTLQDQNEYRISSVNSWTKIPLFLSSFRVGKVLEKKVLGKLEKVFLFFESLLSYREISLNNCIIKKRAIKNRQRNNFSLSYPLANRTDGLFLHQYKLPISL